MKRRSAAGRSHDHVVITASVESDGSGGDSDGESVAEVRVKRRSAAGRSCVHIVITGSCSSLLVHIIKCMFLLVIRDF